MLEVTQYVCRYIKLTSPPSCVWSCKVTGLIHTAPLSMWRCPTHWALGPRRRGARHHSKRAPEESLVMGNGFTSIGGEIKKMKNILYYSCCVVSAAGNCVYLIIYNTYLYIALLKLLLLNDILAIKYLHPAI